jgi:hypothetical protein
LTFFHRVTRSTHLATVGTNQCVLGIEQVPARTTILPPRNHVRRVSSTKILGMSHRLDVARTDARAISAQVIEFKSDRNRTDFSLIQHDMRGTTPRVEPNDSVPITVKESLPNPARRFVTAIFDDVVDGWSKISPWHLDLQYRSGCRRGRGVCSAACLLLCPNYTKKGVSYGDYFWPCS